MREFIRDADGDVWERIGDDSWQCRGEDIPKRDRAGVERKYGPVVACDIDGNALSTPPADVRALVAAAFEDLADRFSAEWSRTPIRHDPLSVAARETAAAMRRGDIRA